MAPPSSSDVSERARDEAVALLTNAVTASAPIPTLRRRLLQLWVGAAFQIAIAIALSIPASRRMVDRAVNPRHDREEMACALERRQRSEGDPVVLPSGEIRRAVVYTPACQSLEDSETHRALTWLFRLIALALLIGTIRQTLRLRRTPVEQAVGFSRLLGPQ